MVKLIKAKSALKKSSLENNSNWSRAKLQILNIKNGPILRRLGFIKLFYIKKN